MKTREPDVIHKFCESCGKRLQAEVVFIPKGYDPQTGEAKESKRVVFTECPEYSPGELEVGHDHFVDGTNMGGIFDYDDDDLD